MYVGIFTIYFQHLAFRFYFKKIIAYARKHLLFLFVKEVWSVWEWHLFTFYDLRIEGGVTGI